jgi:ABC-type nickel/cobalt efflux system permease component RcnA
MIVLGLLILLAVAAVAVGAIARGGADVSIDLGSFTVSTTAAGMFLAGAAALLCAGIGLWLLIKGLRRARRRRQEVQALRDRARRGDQIGSRTRADEDEGDDMHRRGDPQRPDTDDHFDSAPRDG